MLFDYSLVHWLTFSSAGLMLELVPGPSMLYTLGQTGRHGRRQGLVAVAGVITGSGLHVALTVCGLAAIIARSAAFFSAIKWLGAGYLIWLGLCSLRASDVPAGHGQSSPPRVISSRWRAYREGVLVDLFNPKPALFFMAFMPQFVVAGDGPIAAQLALHGVLLLIMASVLDSTIVLIGARLMRLFSGRRRLALWSERGMGAVFVGLGARLAIVHR